MAEELKQKGHVVSQRTICDLLSQMHYSLQSTPKTREGGQHEDRDAQFGHIAKTVADYQTTGDPVISIDTKKRELWATSREPAKNGNRREYRKKSVFMASSIPNWEKWHPMAFMT